MSWRQTGFLAGKYFAGYLKKTRKKGIVFEVWGRAGTGVAEELDTGLKMSARKMGRIKKIYESPPTGWKDEAARKATSEALAAHPDINAIFCQSDRMLGGVTQALKAAGTDEPEGKKGHIEIVSVGCDPSTLKEIESGYLGASIEDNPALYADQTVKALYLYLLGRNPAKKTMLPPQTISKHTTELAMDWGETYKEGQYDSWPLFNRPKLLPTPNPNMS